MYLDDDQIANEAALGESTVELSLYSLMETLSGHPKGKAKLVPLACRYALSPSTPFRIPDPVLSLEHTTITTFMLCLSSRAVRILLLTFTFFLNDR